MHSARPLVCQSSGCRMWVSPSCGVHRIAVRSSPNGMNPELSISARKMERFVRPPVDPRFRRISLARPRLRVRNVEGAPVQLEVSPSSLAVEGKAAGRDPVSGNDDLGVMDPGPRRRLRLIVYIGRPDPFTGSGRLTTPPPRLRLGWSPTGASSAHVPVGPLPARR
jgi:hypothetical protein